jgi:hypothetical protein
VRDLKKEHQKNSADSMYINSESVSNEVNETDLKSMMNQEFERDEEL